MKKVVLALTVALVISGCATPKQYGARGGSKADGIVKMSYSYGTFEKPIVNEAQGDIQALKRCKAWGYNAVESFDFITSDCQQRDGYGSCVRMLVTKEYQCLSE